MMDEIEIPKRGAYFATENGRFHISIEKDTVSIRCVEIEQHGTPRIFTHMPSGNLVLIKAEIEL